MKQIVPAVLVGAAAGFAGLFMREIGLLITGAVLVLLGANYLLQGRVAALGWLMIGTAIPWLILLTPIVIGAVVAPARPTTTVETYMGLVGAILLGAVGVAVVVLASHGPGGQTT